MNALVCWGLPKPAHEWAEIFRMRGFGFWRSRRAARACAIGYWGMPCPECGLPCAMCTAVSYFFDALEFIHTGRFGAAAERMRDAARHAENFHD